MAKFVAFHGITARSLSYYADMCPIWGFEYTGDRLPAWKRAVRASGRWYNEQDAPYVT